LDCVDTSFSSYVLEVSNMPNSPNVPDALKSWLFQCHMIAADKQIVQQTLLNMGFEASLYTPEVLNQLFDPVVLQAGALVASDLKRLEWQMSVYQQNLSLLDDQSIVPRVSDISAEDFFEKYYVANKPVILQNWVSQWPAYDKWTNQYLSETLGHLEIEYTKAHVQDGISHKVYTKSLFCDYLKELEKIDYKNDHYITSYNNPSNQEFVGELCKGISPIPSFLDSDKLTPECVMPWIGPKGTHTGLHIDTANGLLCQVRGKKWVKLAAPHHLPHFYLDNDFFSSVNLFDPNFHQYPKAQHARIIDVELQAGEALFIPATWWHQVISLDESISMTLTNFIYPNTYTTISTVFPELVHNPKNSIPEETSDSTSV